MLPIDDFTKKLRRDFKERANSVQTRLPLGKDGFRQSDWHGLNIFKKSSSPGNT